jgi:hypothetical protein
MNMDMQRGADFLEWVVRAGAIAGVVLVVASIIIACNNFGSRNLALGASALVGVVIAFALQLWFELRPSTRGDQVSFAYTVDFHDRQIRQWDYTKVLGDEKRDALDPTFSLVGPRINTEIEAGKWLFAEHESLVGDRLDKFASDLAIFSLVAFFGYAEQDWQLQVRRYNSPTMPHNFIRPTSKRDQCSVVTEQDVRRQLEVAGNLFAASPPGLGSADICLPPGTSMQIGPNQIALKNRVFQIVFAIEDTGERGGDHILPRSNMQQPKLADGRFRYDTRGQSFDIRTTFFGLHAFDTRF